MDIKELRLGNIVWYTTIRKMIGSVSSIHSDRKVSVDGSVCYSNNVSALKLYGQSFLSLGFSGKKVFSDEYKNPISIYYEMYIPNKGDIVIRSDSTSKKWSVHIDNTDFDTIAYRQVEYVHELQNFVYDVLKHEL